jgi:2-iminobutanoate/2-iminopropanoate deaminase
MPRRAVSDLDSLHQPVGPVSHGIIAENGPFVFVSGQIPLAADGTLVGPDDIVAQYRQAIKNVEKVVVAGGGTMDDVVSLVNYVTMTLRAEMSEYREMAAIREEAFSAPPPASTLVEVNSLMVPGAMVEVEAIAALGGGGSGAPAS